VPSIEEDLWKEFGCAISESLRTNDRNFVVFRVFGYAWMVFHLVYMALVVTDPLSTVIFVAIFILYIANEASFQPKFFCDRNVVVFRDLRHAWKDIFLVYVASMFVFVFVASVMPDQESTAVFMNSLNNNGRIERTIRCRIFIFPLSTSSSRARRRSRISVTKTQLQLWIQDHGHT